MHLKDTARKMLREFKGDSYAFGVGTLPETGPLAARLGRRALVVANSSPWMAPTVEAVSGSLAASGVELAARCEGSRPNSPLEDAYRIQDSIAESNAEVIVAVGGGSTLDATKGAAALAGLSPGVHDASRFFGVGKVTEALGGGRLTPVIAVETAASSGAHLTKYSNLTNLATGQKKLIADLKIVPAAAVFDYAVTASASRDLTLDGAFDGMSHCLEVYCGAKGEVLEKAEPIALAGIELISAALGQAVDEPSDIASRESLGLGTDLGGYAIMTGSTNAAHLTSFSLVDVTTHGRATAVLNPYYMVLFANAIERQLRCLSEVFARNGLLEAGTSALSGRGLALAVAEAMAGFAADLGLPTSLGSLPAFTSAHIERALEAAKDPQLEMKLKAMPVPMDSGMVDDYIRPALEAAHRGNLQMVVTIPA